LYDFIKKFKKHKKINDNTNVNIIFNINKYLIRTNYKNSSYAKL